MSCSGFRKVVSAHVVGVCLLLGFNMIGGFVNAQTMDEWLRPKKTQIEYLVKQLAALKSYTAAVKESGNILDVGLGRIGESKDGEYRRHTDFFKSHQVPGSISLAALQQMEEQGLLPEDVKALLLQSRQYWRIKSRWDYPRLYQWISAIHLGMMNRVKEQGSFVDLLLGRQELEMEDVARAKLLKEVQLEMSQIKSDLLLLHEKGHKYIRYYQLNKN